MTADANTWLSICKLSYKLYEVMTGWDLQGCIIEG